MQLFKFFKNYFKFFFFSVNDLEMNLEVLQAKGGIVGFSFSAPSTSPHTQEPEENMAHFNG